MLGACYDLYRWIVVCLHEHWVFDSFFLSCCFNESSIVYCRELCNVQINLAFVLLAIVVEAHHSIMQSDGARNRQTFTVQDTQANAARCNDPCLLCELLMEHMLKG